MGKRDGFANPVEQHIQRVRHANAEKVNLRMNSETPFLNNFPFLFSHFFHN